MDKAEFEKLLVSCKGAIERYVYFKTPNKTDGDDVLQDVYLTAFTRFDTLNNKDSFKSWILCIARNKCNDYYRRRAKKFNISLDELNENTLTQSRYGVSFAEVVGETLDNLPDRERQILYLYYFQQMRQEDIAKTLSIPVGTVKSRLYTAKQSFKEKYPCSPHRKGEITMTKLPQMIPEVNITKSDKPIFNVLWEEIMGWMVVPKLGEKCNWAFYDYPTRKMTGLYELEVVGKAKVHGIEGVEIASHEKCFAAESYLDAPETERTFVAQLTDTHCRLLSECHNEDGVKELYTFLDGDDFLDNWGFGEDNCGNEIYPKRKGFINLDGDTVTAKNTPCMDIVGRYDVSIGGKIFDTILMIDIEIYADNGIVTEQFIGTDGRTVLFRRYNKNNWAIKHYKKLWTEICPDNLRLTVNGETYVHWYDCITDRVH